MWGHDLPTELQGAAVERELTSDAMVRRAFAAVVGANPGRTEAVIVRASPPAGRDVAIAFLKLPSLGWTVVLDSPHVAAAPAPLRLIDAQLLAGHVIASRAGDPEPDRRGLADILRRVSHLVVDLDSRLVRLELPRVVVAARGARTVVVDAFAELHSV